MLDYARLFVRPWVRPVSVDAWLAEVAELEKKTERFEYSTGYENMAIGVMVAFGLAALFPLAGAPWAFAFVALPGIGGGLLYLRHRRRQWHDFYLNPDQVRLSLLKREVQGPAFDMEMQGSPALYADYLAFRTSPVPMLEGDTETLRARHGVTPMDGRVAIGVIAGFAAFSGLAVLAGMISQVFGGP